jgi:site-specific DNA-cytosine methylase
MESKSGIMIKVASLFSGIGGFEKGFRQASDMTEIVFSSEIDKQTGDIMKD